MPTLYVFKEKKVTVISTAQGTFIRPIRWKVDRKGLTGKWNCSFEGPYVDKLAVCSVGHHVVREVVLPRHAQGPEHFSGRWP